MQKILIIRFSSIGDIILTTPLLRAIKAQKPDTEIHYITKKAYAATLEHNPHIDRLFVLEDKLSDILPQLKIEQYDFIVDLHKNLRSLRIKSYLKKPTSSFDKLNRQKWLLVRFKKNRMPDVHIVHRYFDTLNKIGVTNDHKGLEYYSGLEEQKNIKGLEESIQNNFAAIVIGGTYFTKQIPEEKLNELISKISIPVVLLGGKGDLEIAEKVAQKHPQKAFIAAGKSNLNESAEIIRRSQFVVSSDTGLMHIAAAYQKRIYSVWGNTVPEFGMYPYMPKNPELSVILEVKNLSCRPCSKLGYNNCPKKHFDCMMKQDFSVIGN
ncbi:MULTISPECIES: glycosyltransferase family 9 protein [unclassified Lentimicrobium]|uniref:glycosyltransferase family 9 protein n=1 Tax=unclassified Lentimicrobium TaxID=2677434 RepID=UPI001557974C|nr:MULTISPECIES: glycosyltransferase family 9 protein [unclassified Lentimicrobium]NPD44207.1 glycosyltransferase family 9 protein [Lentimicrobium sp. S6]NPD86448.1 glycosyltransferase family 9 protein [Lentimicrobium sp. L6]